MRRFLLLVLLSVSAACVSAPRARRAPPVPSAVPVATAPSLAGPWASRRILTPQAVRIETRAIVSFDSDQAKRVDTVRSLLEARAAQFPGNARRFDGELANFAVATGASAPTSIAGLTLPTRFSGELGAAFRLPLPSTVCTDPAFNAVQGLQDAWIALPDTLRIGRAWTDTVLVSTCRDRIPLQGTVIRRFTVARAELVEGRATLFIDRATSSVLHGAGEQFGEQVELAGSGRGSMEYLLDAESMRWVRGAGRSTLQLTFTSARRSQRVRQDAELSLAWAR